MLFPLVAELEVAPVRLLADLLAYTPTPTLELRWGGVVFENGQLGGRFGPQAENRRWGVGCKLLEGLMNYG